MRVTHAPEVAPLRAASYPSIGDQLDALWKLYNALATGTPTPADALAVRDAVAAVKEKYKKTGTVSRTAP